MQTNPGDELLINHISLDQCNDYFGQPKMVIICMPQSLHHQ